MMIEESAAPAGRVRLRTLGTLELTGPGGPDLRALVGQPKRAALLVYLAVARPHGLHRRDTLLALLWPESDQTRARHALSQLVYQLRRTLGATALLSRGDEALGIDPLHLWTDVAAFDAALNAGRLEEALELHRGDFLAGVHVPDAAPELEEWIAAERARLRSTAGDAAWRMAEREERAGNGSGAVHWARRATTFTPEDESAVARLIGLLGRLGDRTGALRVYDEFARRLSQEFEIRPSAPLRSLAEDLRRTPVGATASPSVSPEPSPLSPVTPPRGSVAWSGKRFGLGATAVALILAGIGGVVRLLRSGTPTPILAVGAIADVTHGDTAASATVAVGLLSTSLARLPSVQVIATARLYEVQAQLQAARPAATLYDAARAAGAKQLIQGTLQREADGVRLDLERIDIATGAVRSGYRAEGRDLFAAVDQATTAIAGDLGAPAPAERVTEVTTRSLVAYRLYEAGLRAYYQRDPAAADRLFRAALDEDTTFAMAAYWVWVTRGDEERSYLQRAARLADHATDRERLLIRAKLAESEMQPAALALAETLAYRYPGDPDAQLFLGEVRSYAGDFLGAVAPLRRVIVLDSLGLGGRLPQCRACDAYHNLAAMYVYADSLPAAFRVVREWIARQTSSSYAWESLSDILELATEPDSALAARQVADSLASAPHSQAQVRARLALRRGDYEDADRRLRQLIADHAWNEAEWFLAISLRDQGRLHEAAGLAVAHQPPLRSILLLEQGHVREAALDFEATAHTPLMQNSEITGHIAKHVAFNLTHAATGWAAAGDTGRLAALADSIETIGRNSLSVRERLLAHYVRGLLLSARGQPSLAAAEFRQSMFSWTEGLTRVNFELAKSLLQLGRPREAIAALQPAFRGSLEAANLYITRTELHELLAQAFDAAGERDSAATHWRAVESAWRNADPELLGRWEVAKQRLTVGDSRRR